MTVDIKSAFLNLHLTQPSGVKLLLKVDKVMVIVLVGLFQGMATYLNKRGEITVRLNKAINGIVEAALLLYKPGP